jgi:hypothetical protein
MNTFCKHHQNSIKFSYHRLDYILLNGLIWPFQQPERVIVNAYRHRSHPALGSSRDDVSHFLPANNHGGRNFALRRGFLKRRAKGWKWVG